MTSLYFGQSAAFPKSGLEEFCSHLLYFRILNQFLWSFKVHIFWEGHKILRNLHPRFVLRSNGQIYIGDFANIWTLHNFLKKRSLKQRSGLSNFFMFFRHGQKDIHIARYNVHKGISGLKRKNILSDCHYSDEINYLMNAFRWKKK